MARAESFKRSRCSLPIGYRQRDDKFAAEGQRIAQLMGHHRQELDLPAVRLFGVRLQLLRGQRGHHQLLVGRAQAPKTGLVPDRRGLNARHGPRGTSTAGGSRLRSPDISSP